MNKQKMLLSAGLVMFGVSAAHAASMMPTNPMGTVFAPWNTMPGGFSPLNNGFTSGGPMGVSPFSMSPFGSNGSPWGSMPSTMMPWNAWRSSPGSVVPWGNQMPYGNFSNFTNNGSGMWLPWGSNFSLWNSWAGTRNRNNQYYYNNRNRDAWYTMMLMQGLNGQQNLPGLMPGMTGSPPLSSAPMMAAPQRPANTLPVQPVPKNTQESAVVQSLPKTLNPFSPQVAATPSAPVESKAAPGFNDPFSDSLAKGAADAANSNISSNDQAPSFDPFATDDPEITQQQPQSGLQFPDAESFFTSE